MNDTVSDPLWWRATIIFISLLIVLVVALVLALVAYWLIRYFTQPLPYHDPESREERMRVINYILHGP